MKGSSGSLQVVENTIRFHLKNIYHKLQVHNRLLAISAARGEEDNLTEVMPINSAAVHWCI